MMRTKHRLMLQTTVAIFLSINIHVTHNQTPRLLTIPLLPLTTLLTWSWTLTNAVSGFIQEVDQRLDELQQWLSVRLILMTIGCRSVLYGAGVNL